jgi:hypothetical protein
MVGMWECEASGMGHGMGHGAAKQLSGAGPKCLHQPTRCWSLNSALLYSAKQANIGSLSGILLKTLIGRRDGLADKTVRMRKVPVDGGPDSPTLPCAEPTNRRRDSRLPTVV